MRRPQLATELKHPVNVTTYFRFWECVAEQQAPSPRKTPSAKTQKTQMGIVTLACLLAAPAVHAFVQAPRLGATPNSRRAAVRLAEEGESLTDAFKSFVEAAKPKKPGEGAATRTDVRGLPIRLGGETRDNSLGSLRAAAQNLEVLKDPRQWQAEEIGLLAALGSIFAAIVWGYFTYVAPPEAQAPPPSKAAGATRARAAPTRTSGSLTAPGPCAGGSDAATKVGRVQGRRRVRAKGDQGHAGGRRHADAAGQVPQLCVQRHGEADVPDELRREELPRVLLRVRCVSVGSLTAFGLDNGD